jgi:hypothetical protein
MGCHSSKPTPKDGELYSRIRDSLRSFDLVLFSGDDFVSDFIKFAEHRELKKPHSGDFSHAGLIVRGDILNHPNVQPDKIYIWESTMSGKLADGVNNIDGRAFLGVQLRDFDEVVAAYDKPNDTKIAICRLQHPPTITPELKTRFTEFFTDTNGRIYDLNFYSLFASLFPCLRCAREPLEQITHTRGWLFCSELVALTYVHMGIFPGTVNPKNVVPVDFLPGIDEDKEVPCIIQAPEYITTMSHYRFPGYGLGI